MIDKLSKLEQVLYGLEIFKKYNELEVSVDEYTIYGGYSGSDTEMSDDDIEKLKNLGWFYDDPFECWAIKI